MEGLTVLPAVRQTDRAALPEGVGAIIDGMDVAEATRGQYRREIRVFLEWLDGGSLHPNTLVAFKKHLKARTDIGAGTKAKYLSVARAFLRELYRLQLIPTDITTNVKGIGVTRQHKRSPLNEDEIHRVFAYLNSDDADPRARVIIALMYLQGLRRVEVARLRVEDFDRESKTLAVLGKGKDDYERVDLHPRMVELLVAYLKAEGRKSGPLLASPYRDGAHLSSNAIWRIAMRAHRAVGLSDRNLHGWRKSFTTRLIRTGMNLMEVQGFTRHASVQMLQVYYQRLEREKTLPTYYQAFEGV